MKIDTTIDFTNDTRIHDVSYIYMNILYNNQSRTNTIVYLIQTSFNVPNILYGSDSQINTSSSTTISPLRPSVTRQQTSYTINRQ